MMLPLPVFALMLVFAGLLVGGLVAFGLARNVYLRPDDAKSPPAFVTGPRDVSGNPPQAPPVADAGGETG